MKIFADKKCYVSKMSQDEPSMDEVELGMKKVCTVNSVMKDTIYIRFSNINTCGESER